MTRNPARMKQGYFLGILAMAAACAAFAGCNVSGIAGSLTGGGGASPTPPIPSADYYVNGGQTPNQIYGLSTASIAAGGAPVGLTGQPYSTMRTGSTGAPFGMAFALSNSVLYVSNYDDSSVTFFPVNADGSLGAASAPVSVGAGPSGLCVDPSSSFLVVVNSAANTIQSFTIGVTGALTLVNAGTTNLSSPQACAFAADSKTVYVSNSTNGLGVSSYSVSAAGTLSAAANYPLSGLNFQGIAATASAVFASSQGGNGVGVYQIASGGTLLPGSLTTTALAPIGLAITPNGKYLYVASAAAQGVDAWSVNGISLTHIAGPYQVFTNGLSYIAINSAGTLLVALNVVDRSVSPFAITGTGTLGFAPQAGYIFAGAGNPKAIIAR